LKAARRADADGVPAGRALPQPGSSVLLPGWANYGSGDDDAGRPLRRLLPLALLHAPPSFAVTAGGLASTAPTTTTRTLASVPLIFFKYGATRSQTTETRSSTSSSSSSSNFL